MSIARSAIRLGCSILAIVALGSTGCSSSDGDGAGGSKAPGKQCSSESECAPGSLGALCEQLVPAGVDDPAVCIQLAEAAVGDGCAGEFTPGGGRHVSVGSTPTAPLCNGTEASCPGATLGCPAGDTYCLSKPTVCTPLADGGQPCGGSTYASCKTGFYCPSNDATTATCTPQKQAGESCGTYPKECLGDCVGSKCEST